MFKNMNSKKTIGLLVALVLVTACFIGGTIARYVTSTSSEDEARVAIWDINKDNVTMDLFNATYELSDGTVVAQSNDGDDIIAPGTSKESYFSIVNNGTFAPETMYEIAIDINDSEIDPLILNNPSIQWKLDNNEWSTWEDCKDDILSLVGNTTGINTYAPGTTAEEFASGKKHTIAWQWLMDNGTDEQDTAIANVAVERDITATVSIKVTATQVNGATIGITNGNGAVYNTLNPQPLSFRSSAPINELQSVKVGNNILNMGSDYTIAEGSTIVILNEEYLNTLNKGNHTISIISDNVTARGSFKKITKSIDPVSHNNTIPVGGIYNSNGVTYTAGQPFPEIQDGDTYTYGDYEYKYNYAFNYSSVDPTMTEEQIEKWTPNNSQNGWGVRYNGNKENPEEIITEINNKPITNLDATFAFTNIKVSPTIPNTTKSMYATYICSTLETASTIPENVSDIGMTFTGCVNLGGIIKLNISNDIIYPNDMTFDGTNKPIILTGSYTQVEDFIYNYDNILTENYNLMYVDGFLFRFTPETTWEEWIESSYNSHEITISENKITKIIDGKTTVLYEADTNNKISPANIIEPRINKHYTFQIEEINSEI